MILTTHSSNIVKQLDYNNLRLVNCTEDNKKEIDSVIPRRLKYPSLNEVNYIAFGEVSVEYHDELYAYIEYQGWKNEYTKGKKQIKYIKIRNIINRHFTDEELKESIDLMRKFIEDKSNMIEEP